MRTAPGQESWHGRARHAGQRHRDSLPVVGRFDELAGREIGAGTHVELAVSTEVEQEHFRRIWSLPRSAAGATPSRTLDRLPVTPAYRTAPSSARRACPLSFNVSGTFRGGETSRVLARLMAALHAVFGATSFSVEPYQLGQENDESVASGAWWFWFKHGFAPRDAEEGLRVGECCARWHRPLH